MSVTYWDSILHRAHMGPTCTAAIALEQGEGGKLIEYTDVTRDDEPVRYRNAVEKGTYENGKEPVMLMDTFGNLTKEGLAYNAKHPRATLKRPSFPTSPLPGATWQTVPAPALV